MVRLLSNDTTAGRKFKKEGGEQFGKPHTKALLTLQWAEGNDVHLLPQVRRRDNIVAKALSRLDKSS